MNIIAQTLRMIIREFLPEELETYLTHFTDDEVARYLPKRSRDERIVIFNNALSQYLTTKATGIWGIFDNATGEFIGSCLLRPFNDEPGILEVGYSMEKKYWGRGIGTEMALAMITHGFADINITEIVACTTFENVASQRVLQKAGLKPVENLIRNGEELAFFRLKR
ncbi:GNAT family N-acetyltransferase [Mucilaginibacter sp. UR6-11]|uniref:GNAT family N-acetyltransferase n=1 Tax=Mucilaginibacter sp. UR6-11 TaxID=1435644 RepID=UPI001E42FF1E|nr:GNAT family N-acetyltransferase [Mucilaginibacter sp. UR6-11]MCC8425546.1 GNAT family N-acetyltransferase [Mucilaginibacter sp. UR6-11]